MDAQSDSPVFIISHTHGACIRSKGFRVYCWSCMVQACVEVPPVAPLHLLLISQVACMHESTFVHSLHLLLVAHGTCMRGIIFMPPMHLS